MQNVSVLHNVYLLPFTHVDFENYRSHSFRVNYPFACIINDLVPEAQRSQRYTTSRPLDELVKRHKILLLSVPLNHHN